MEKQLKVEKKNWNLSIINTAKILNPKQQQQSFSLHSSHSVGMLPDLSDLGGGCLSTGSCLSFQTALAKFLVFTWLSDFFFFFACVLVWRNSYKVSIRACSIVNQWKEGSYIRLNLLSYDIIQWLLRQVSLVFCGDVILSSKTQRSAQLPWLSRTRSSWPPWVCI